MGRDGMMGCDGKLLPLSVFEKKQESYTDHVSPYKQLWRACCRGKFCMDVESSWIPQTILYQTDSRCSHAGLLWFPLAKTLEQKHCWIQLQCWKYCWITPLNFEDFQQKFMSYLHHPGKKINQTSRIFQILFWRRWAHQIASPLLAPLVGTQKKIPHCFPPCGLRLGLELHHNLGSEPSF